MSRRRKVTDGGFQVRIVCKRDGHSDFSFGMVWISPEREALPELRGWHQVVVTESPAGLGLAPHAVYNFACEVCGATYPVNSEKLMAACIQYAALGESRLNLAQIP